MDFFQIQSQTSLNIDLFIKNYLTWSFKILWQTFKKKFETS